VIETTRNELMKKSEERRQVWVEKYTACSERNVERLRKASQVLDDQDGASP
jgi:hypothetical protein